MKIVDLGPDYEDIWLHCLEPEVEEIRDGVERKRAWFAEVRHRGLVVKLAIDDDGAAAGMIQALPVEETGLDGEDLLFVQCVWVHGGKRGIGRRQGHGIGEALLAAVEGEAIIAGTGGIAAWGMALPLWMKASWFRNRGYRRVDRDGIALLLWKPLRADALPPHWRKGVVEPALDAQDVTVTCFDGGWCTLQNANCARARQAAWAAGDGVVLVDVDTVDPESAQRWRQDYGIWVDHRQVHRGPPLGVQKVSSAIEKGRRLRARAKPHA